MSVLDCYCVIERFRLSRVYSKSQWDIYLSYLGCLINWQNHIGTWEILSEFYLIKLFRCSVLHISLILTEFVQIQSHGLYLMNYLSSSGQYSS